MKKRRIRNLSLLIVLLAFFLVLGEESLRQKSQSFILQKDITVSNLFRAQNLSEEMLIWLQSEKETKTLGRDAGLYLLETSCGTKPFPGEYSQKGFAQLERKWTACPGWDDYRSLCSSLWEDVQYFPVPASDTHPDATVSYENSWMNKRTYRADNYHEGTDLMAGVNRNGYYPIVSMTDGTITNMGWLELGGYRVGVTSPRGTYFYYAHLSSYSNIREGMEIKAGDLLGFMGDTGYGKEEGTHGKFPVHLHLGIYRYQEGREISYNPYWILRLAENRKIHGIF